MPKSSDFKINKLFGTYLCAEAAQVLEHALFETHEAY